MNDTQRIAHVMGNLLTRVSRLEIAALALTKAMAEGGTLPPSFAEQYKEDLKDFTDRLQPQSVAEDLKELGDQWSPVFDALSEVSAAE